MSKIQVAHIGGHSYFNPQEGIDAVNIEISQRLSKYGVKTTYYARHYLCPARKQRGLIEEKPALAIRIKYLEILSYSFISSLKVSFSDADIVHYHTLWAALFSFIPRLFGKKVIVSCHAIEWARRWNFTVKNIMKLLDWISLLYNRKLVVISKPLYDYYKKRAQKVFFLPNGVTMPEFIKREKIQSYILFCSRLVPEKGAHYLISAFKDLGSDFNGYKLYICGGSMHTDSYVRALKKLDPGNKNIIFPGYVSGKEKHKLFSNASIYVLPSEIEGMSISLLEAMSYGIPVLVSDIKENRDLVNNNGFYFKSKNVESLKSALEYMMRNSGEMKEKAQNAETFVQKNHNWDNVSKKYYQLYKSI